MSTLGLDKKDRPQSTLGPDKKDRPMSTLGLDKKDRPQSTLGKARPQSTLDFSDNDVRNKRTSSVANLLRFLRD